MWLIGIDAATKWPEVIKMNNDTTAEWTIEILQSLFSRFGLPNQIASDNGPQFTSDVYHQFCTDNGIRRTLIAPYHPRSNGKEEICTKFQECYQKRETCCYTKSFLCQFLLKYRTTPHPKTGETPSKLMFGREVKTRLHRLHPDDIEKPLQTAVLLHTRKFKCDNPAWVRKLRRKTKMDSRESHS